jgi:hypothetical protein
LQNTAISSKPGRLADTRCVVPQTPAISIPNELTVAHNWKDEKKPREYDFDAVFGPTASQVRRNLQTTITVCRPLSTVQLWLCVPHKQHQHPKSLCNSMYP